LKKIKNSVALSDKLNNIDNRPKTSRDHYPNSLNILTKSPHKTPKIKVDMDKKKIKAINIKSTNKIFNIYSVEKLLKTSKNILKFEDNNKTNKIYQVGLADNTKEIKVSIYNNSNI
jgi:hypothetical protein